ncbi:hypothetical protein, partial [Limnospira sp.]|uniref:hypothetical protein n=1 Tax=Limnospira sp. TaxID=3100384 RepID=UPI003F6F3444
RLTQHSRTLVGWVERSRNPTQSARLGVVKFLSGFLGSYNLLICWVYGVHPTYSWCDRFTQNSRLGWEWLSFGGVSWVHPTYSWSY